jgi:hypothetical protein
MKKNYFVWISAMLMMAVGMSSCSSDDSDDDNSDKKGGSYIITSQPSMVGITYAILAGEFYPDNIPSAYSSTPTRTISLGIEVSMSDVFKDDEVYTAYSRGIEDNHMEVTVHGLSPNTDYYYRAFIDMGTLKLYGEKKTFKTSALPLAYDAEEASDITFTGASIKARFINATLPISYEDQNNIHYGIAYSTDKDIFSRTQSILNSPDYVGLFIKPIGYSYDETLVIDGLKPGQTCYYCIVTAFDPKQVCQFGPIKSFTTKAIEPSQLVTLDATNVSYFSATLKAATTLPSLIASLYPEAKDISYGICYAPEAAYSGNSYLPDEIFPNLATNVTFRDGTITAQLSDLEVGTKYLFRPYVRFSSFDIVGDVKSFTTSTVQGELMVDAVDVKFISADVTGHTQLPNSITGLSYVFNYDIINSSHPWPNEVAMTVDGDRLTTVARGLNPGHSYECWITANMNGRTIATSEKKTFKAQNPGDYIYLDDASDITSTSAVINCKLDPYAFEGQNFVYIYYGKNKNDLTQLATATADGDHFSIKLTNLLPNTTYYYQGSSLCILSFGYGDWFYSGTRSFTTLPK